MNEFVAVKTADLVGAALDWAVAKLQGLPVALAAPAYGNGWRVRFDLRTNQEKYSPSTDWSQGGPLINSNQIFLEPPREVHRAFLNEKSGRVSGVWQTYESWHATVSARVRTLPPKHEGFPGLVGRGEGDTPLIAACRAIVASVLGETVSVPKELLS
ncbi:DUF2591 family protein [Pseudomonas sp. CDFA 602]|uniref:phage protein NinX family protein n=1 Tax=Pseudomonas californiensis TaxID=2829823 RepID=UPI001E30D42D|nr:phage protein NinX family protein [Pseudomonas californiensis]MCD5994172.1 DUF2591 family protein [Pseudomonas californiensis]MCD5999729.1 DUF2591 family protein [Pseudomonas californiensis]